MVKEYRNRRGACRPGETLYEESDLRHERKQRGFAKRAVERFRVVSIDGKLPDAGERRVFEVGSRRASSASAEDTAIFTSAESLCDAQDTP